MSGSVSLMSRDGREVHWVVRTFEGEFLSKKMFLTLPGVSEEIAIQRLILKVYNKYYYKDLHLHETQV